MKYLVDLDMDVANQVVMEEMRYLATHAEDKKFRKAARLMITYHAMGDEREEILRDIKKKRKKIKKRIDKWNKV